MTASFRLGCRVDTQHVLDRYPFLACRNRGFDAVSLVLRAATALVYSSGSVVLVGGKSRSQMLDAMRELSLMLDREPASDLIVHNIVVSGVSEPRPLQSLYKRLRDNTQVSELSFEPELFPALTMRLRDTSLKCCVFRTGRINVTGIKSEEEILGSVRMVTALLAGTTP